MTTLTLLTHADAARVAHDLALHHGVCFRVSPNCLAKPEADLWDVCGPDGFDFQLPAWYSDPDPSCFTIWQSLLDEMTINDNRD